MKKTTWVLIAVLLLIASLILIGVLVDRHREKNVNSYVFPETLVVQNFTEHKRADTLGMIILNKIYAYDTIDLHIFYMHKEMKNDDFEIAAFIQKNPMPHSYSIFLKKRASKGEIMKFMSHELIHLTQMESGELKTFIGNYEYNIFNGDTIKFSEVPYKSRPFESEAFTEEKKVFRELIQYLYK